MLERDGRADKQPCCPAVPNKPTHEFQEVSDLGTCAQSEQILYKEKLVGVLIYQEACPGAFLPLSLYLSCWSSQSGCGDTAATSISRPAPITSHRPQATRHRLRHAPRK